MLAQANTPRPGLLNNRYFVIACLVLLTVVGAYFRFVGVNWDQDTHQHPDERFMTMVAEQIQPLEELSDYFDPEESALNPFEFGSYTYGMLPLFLVRYIAEWLDRTSYNEIVLVGRVLSGIFDLAALWVLYLIGARLYSRIIGLLAAALYAAAVLPIQLSHFFAVDSFTTVFMLGAFYFAVLISERPRWRWFALFGILTGLALTTKVSIAPLAGLVVVAGVMYLAEVWPDLLQRTGKLKHVLVGVLIAGFLAALFFRIFQPYSFEGPGFFGVTINDNWVRIMREVSNQVAGKADYPPNHHWAGRPWSYGWTNMVRWGMGLPLGLAATLAWFWALWRIWKGEWRTHLLPVLWVGGYFLWQSSQFWRYTRYFLPIYPLAILLAAWALVEALKIIRSGSPVWLSSERGTRLRRILRGALVAVVLGGTYAYAYAFIQIYRQPHPRVAASHWMLEEIPGPFKAILETSEGSQTIPLPQATNLVLQPGTNWTGTFSSEAGGILTGIVTPYFSPAGDRPFDAEMTFTIAEKGDPSAASVMSVATVHVESARQTHRIEIPEFEIAAGELYELKMELVSGLPVTMSGAAIALETRWDDSLPLTVGGIYAYPGLFQPLDLELHEQDTAAKRDKMLAVLAQADYVVIPSNRAYDAMPRLPLRFPMTIAYYQALFGCDSAQITKCAYPARAPLKGELGFELIATFESYPRLGPISLPDQSAQESFTVYDHPRVFIFKKADDFSLSKARSILEAVDLSRVIAQSASQVTEAPHALQIPADRLEAQRDGGTWSNIFSPASALNRTPAFGVLGWYVLVFLIGWFAFPLAFLAFRGLADRGYGLSRLAGLLVVGWIAWFGSSYDFFAFSRVALWAALGVLGILGAAIAWINFDRLLDHLKSQWRHLLTLEGIFLALFLFSLLLRWNNPDLWHPWRGGEKPGDLALFQAVLKTVHFPPYDPWMAGNYVNYFYFGYVLAAVPTKLLGLLPEFAFNLLIPTWFGLTGVPLFSIAYNLAAARPAGGPDTSTQRPHNRLPYLAGYAALIVGLLLGNFAQVRILWEQLPRLAPDPVVDPSFAQQARDAAAGLREVLAGEQELYRGDQGVWYFDASRAIQSGETVLPITEFPYFTFLYADLHPHLLGMPVMLLALAWLLSFLHAPPRLSRRSLREEPLSLAAAWLMGGLAVGATYPTNTWDFPAVMVLAVLAIGFASWRYPETGFRYALLELVVHIGLLYVLAVGLFAPFRQWFGTGTLSPELWPGPRTPFGDYLVVHGLFVFVILTYMLAETRHWIRPRLQWLMNTPLGELVPDRWTIIAWLAGIILVMVLLRRMWADGYETAIIVTLLGLWAGGLALQTGRSRAERIILVLIGAGLGLSLVAELVAIQGDVGRMNVVFKSYLLVWFFFSIAGGTILALIWPRLRAWRLRMWWLGVLAGLVLAAAIYPLTGTFARLDDRWPDVQNPPRALDGLAFMNGESGGGGGSVVYREGDAPLRLAADLEAFWWIRENIQGTPTIVEAHTGEYRWGSRYSVYTGLPTVVGWSWHLRQHNVVLPASAVEARIADVHNFYNTEDQSVALDFLERYDVRLIVVGELERALYTESGLDKFARMAAAGDLEIVYPENGEPGPVTIFAVP